MKCQNSSKSEKRLLLFCWCQPIVHKSIAFVCKKKKNENTIIIHHRHHRVRRAWTLNIVYETGFFFRFAIHKNGLSMFHCPANALPLNWPRFTTHSQLSHTHISSLLSQIGLAQTFFFPYCSCSIFSMRSNLSNTYKTMVYATWSAVTAINKSYVFVHTSYFRLQAHARIRSHVCEYDALKFIISPYKWSCDREKKTECCQALWIWSPFFSYPHTVAFTPIVMMCNSSYDGFASWTNFLFEKKFYL